MARIIIDFPDELPPNLVMSMVQSHVREGKISVAAGIPHYCWVTTFAGPVLKGWSIVTRRKKAGQDSDSFSIQKAYR